MKTAKENNVTDSDLLEKWYRKDGNNVPPVYVLQVIFLLYYSYWAGNHILFHWEFSMMFIRHSVKI